MRTRQYGASFGPQALKVILRAFDEAWTEIAGNFGGDPHLIQAARLQLATAVLSVASDDSRNAGAMRTAALQAMARRYQAPPSTSNSRIAGAVSQNRTRSQTLVTLPEPEPDSITSQEARTRNCSAPRTTAVRA